MRIVLPLLLFSLTSCGVLKKVGYKAPAPEVKRTEGRQVLGRVASVSEPGKFVLIQKYGPGKLPKNTLFQSHGISGSQASLRPTGERVRDFFAADIVSGEALIGDAVTGLKIVAEKPVMSPIEVENTAETPSNDVSNE